MANSDSNSIVALPSRLFFSALSAFVAFLRPLLPHILPLLVYLSFIPLVLFFSASAGWIVWRNVAVGWQAPLYLQYGDGVPPYALATLPALVAQQRYDISLQLQVPNLDANYALGNFMTTLTLSTRSNKTLTSIRRPAILVPPRVAFYSSAPAVITVEVPLLTAYAAGVSHVVATVEVGRRDNWKSLGNEQGRELSVITASLRGVVVHHGIRGLVTRLPLLSALISSIAFLIVSSIIVGVCILPLAFRHAATQPKLAQVDIQPLPAISNSSSDDSESVEEKPLVQRRRSRPSSRTAIKTEDTSTTVLPPQTVPQGPLRRRRSKLVDPVSSDSES
ncbi:putative adipose-regulatory protein-domain-containing protein [Mycena metata]|uniref:Adipose-regulatory protein-domain-containing protein n=1 Tax=Mycena metata TaxID=1033252 RepID=A0AAD7KI93_9AGAR|nr:putative adipose-regulatory protein-domain-containing protein [Mycena metata]